METQISRMLELLDTMKGDWYPRAEDNRRRQRAINIGIFLIGLVSGVLIIAPYFLPVPEVFQDIAIGMISGILSGVIVTKALQATDEGKALNEEAEAILHEISSLGEELRQLDADHKRS